MLKGRFLYASLAALLFAAVACIDPYLPEYQSTVNVVVVDGAITNLAEPQVLYLSRSRADSITGRFGTSPLTGVQAEVVINGNQAVKFSETDPGKYELPSEFRGLVGSSYQLRFQLPGGPRYESAPEVLQAAPSISSLRIQFNPKSLPTQLLQGFTAAHDIYLTTQDPANETNFYRWDWQLYEKQEWCKSCLQGVYTVYEILPKTYMFGSYFVSGTTLYEDCFVPPYDPTGQAPAVNKAPFKYDYRCRTQCWEIIRNHSLLLFDDAFSNGGPIFNKKVAQIPYYAYQPCLVAIRQSALTKEAYRYFKLVEAQTQNTGGLADTPPAAPVGNVHNVANRNEAVVGYFAVTGVSEVRHWLDRKDAVGLPFGAVDAPENLTPEEVLFFALNRRTPNPEPTPPYTGPRPSPAILIYGGPPRPPTAICYDTDSRTPRKPTGWRD
ncbi:MAG: DUF4249 domain-containing protein [Spirosomataceae bacterium]